MVVDGGRTRRDARRARARRTTRWGRWWSRAAGERGSATAEYAVVVLAAVAFAGVLVAVVRSGAVQSLLSGIISDALSL
ncbi:MULTISPECIES: DUF4244 domain-containing protein [unclassified Curtobacterium]|uniref:DUF4244 domain-containing protein n=1 Tax=unclassified Curtobacterium TaxID=257496 RepID=UPI000DA7C1E1|nr:MULTISPECIES: DUF4244 domain-containing protein [unclassified Curtobacterium]PZE26478.1 DUF4244 domain-containing protein [Curtobacterium sp. MCBD17_028]PZF64382.1 DUF4244 domain-containing protein [Curtobacterium sp. MCBD17_013]WIE53629.1 DUF4244 domain-containing protein [Curtobacterium sp. MCBD17_003]